MSPPLDMRKGSTTVLVLTLLAERPMYGYQLVKELERRSEGYFNLKEGTLYPALHRLEKEGLVRSEWRVTDQGPARKYYHLTEKGRRALDKSVEEWGTFARKLLTVLDSVS
ncbi:MAG: helix-turn-helix transcriptional regulator [Anaerolineae bacterium]|nr:helix-turn-helix transcriptional regulator [Anaerolineae bacterium]